MRKKFLICEIARSNTQRKFYRNCMIMMSHLKEFLRLFAASNLHGSAQDPKKKHPEHAYALYDDDDRETSSDSDLEPDNN